MFRCIYNIVGNWWQCWYSYTMHLLWGSDSHEKLLELLASSYLSSAFPGRSHLVCFSTHALVCLGTRLDIVVLPLNDLSVFPHELEIVSILNLKSARIRQSEMDQASFTSSMNKNTLNKIHHFLSKIRWMFNLDGNIFKLLIIIRLDIK